MSLNKTTRAIIVATVLVSVGISAMASTSGGGSGGSSEFGQLFNTLNSWVTGFLGKALALFAFVIGAGMGLARSNLMPAIIGIVFALFLSLGPNIISSMFTAVA
jgi:conjugal transfer pilus assembly protein TraA